MSDVIVVGMGPGGEAVATNLAKSGMDVVGVEQRLLGGECPYYGCIPSKMMLRAAHALAEARRVPELAGTSTVSPDFAPVARRIRDEATDDWDDQVAVRRFEDAGGTFVRGRGVVTGPRTVQVGERQLTASRAIVINAGTDPLVPPIPGLADTPYWTNRGAVAATGAPDSLIVLGAGPIGVELAQVFARFGSHVDVVEAAPRMLSDDEPEAGSLLADVFEREGIGVRVGSSVRSVSYESGTFTLALGGGFLSADRLLVATGRRTDLAGLGLDSVGVDVQQKVVDPDGWMRIADGVYAVGDITGKGAFTHISMYQAGIVSDHILGNDPQPAEYHAVPRVTFTDPEIGAVGLTEAAAHEAGLPVTTSSVSLSSSSRGFIHKAGADGFIKLVADTERGILVGATSAGPCGGEVLSMLTLAVQERIPISHLSRMIYAFPTFHRAVEDALDGLP